MRRAKQALAVAAVALGLGGAVPAAAQAAPSYSTMRSNITWWTNYNCARYTGCHGQYTLAQPKVISCGYAGTGKCYTWYGGFYTTYYGLVCTRYEYNDYWGWPDSEHYTYFDC